MNTDDPCKTNDAISYTLQAYTRLLHVCFKADPSGTINPIAKIEPLVMGGKTVRWVDLHNMDNIMRLDLHLGDTVIIRQKPNATPEIISVVLNKRLPGALPVQALLTRPSCEVAR